EPKSATWESAAQALRSGNREEATRLLAQLSESEKPETRDAATLVRLHAAVQKAASAQSSAPLAPEELNQLRALAQSVATAYIRASARRLLNEVEEARSDCFSFLRVRSTRTEAASSLPARFREPPEQTAGGVDSPFT